MRFLIQLIANNLLQEVPSVCLITNRRHVGKKYLFNTPQQFSRYCNRHHLNLSQNNVLFFTKYSTDTLAGLVRVVLQLNDGQNAVNSKIYLNFGAYQFWNFMGKFLKSRMINYSFYDYQTGNVKLGISKIEQIDQLISHSEDKFYRGKFTNEQLQEILKQPNNAKQRMRKVESKDEKQSYWIYQDEEMQIRTFRTWSQQKQEYYNHICTSKVQPINLDKQKLEQVQKRYNFKFKSKQISQLLASGSLVILGKVNLKLDDFIKSYSENQMSGLAIFHYSSQQQLQQLIDSQCLNSYLSASLSLNFIVHIVEGDGSVLFSQEFSKLRQKFGSKATHIIYNKYCRYFEDNNALINSMNYFYLHFKILHNVQTYGFFPNFYTNLQKVYLKYIVQRRQLDFKQLTTLTQHTKQNCDGKVLFYEPLYQLTIAPLSSQGYKYFDNSLKESGQQSIKQKMQQKLEVQKVETKATQLLKQRTESLDPRVIFLGTSSSRSNRMRNVSGTLVKFQYKKQSDKNKQFSLLVDCGDGIHDQLINHFGNTYEQELMGIKVLFMTHFHQDHCAGLFSLLNHRNKLIRHRVRQGDRRQHRIFVVIPENMIEWFQMYCENIQSVDQFVQIVTTQSLQPKKGLFSKEVKPNKQQEIKSNKKQESKANKQQENKAKQKQLKKAIFSKQKLERNENKKEKDGVQEKQQVARKEKISQFVKRAKEYQTNSNQCFPIEQLNIEQQQENDDLKSEKMEKVKKENLTKFKQFLALNQITNFVAVPVVHCSQSYGLIIQHESRNKIAFSGDCRPTQFFLKMAQDSTVMVHQATYMQGQQNRAKLFNHSSAAEAIEMYLFYQQSGYKSKSLYTLLTHFTAANPGSNLKAFEKRFADIQKLKPNVDRKYLQNNVILAYDHLQFKVSELYQLPKLIAALERQKIF